MENFFIFGNIPLGLVKLFHEFMLSFLYVQSSISLNSVQEKEGEKYRQNEFSGSQIYKIFAVRDTRMPVNVVSVSLNMF